MAASDPGGHEGGPHVERANAVGFVGDGGDPQAQALGGGESVGSATISTAPTRTGSIGSGVRVVMSGARRGQLRLLELVAA